MTKPSKALRIARRTAEENQNKVTYLLGEVAQLKSVLVVSEEKTTSAQHHFDIEVRDLRGQLDSAKGSETYLRDVNRQQGESLGRQSVRIRTLERENETLRTQVAGAKHVGEIFAYVIAAQGVTVGRAAQVCTTSAEQMGYKLTPALVDLMLVTLGTGHRVRGEKDIEFLRESARENISKEGALSELRSMVMSNLEAFLRSSSRG